MSRHGARFSSRLGFALGALLAVALGVLGFALAGEMRRGLTDDLSRSLLAQARMAASRAQASASLPLKAGSARAEAAALSAACACRATLVAPDGTLAGDSDLDAPGLARAENHAARPEIAAALAGGEGFAVRHSATVGRDFLYAAMPLKTRDGRVAGAARLAIPAPDLERRVARARGAALLVSLAVFGAALLAAWALARSAGRPLEEMAAVAARLASGDYSARVRAPAQDERGVLGETLNVLASRVEETVRELERDKGQLAAVLDQMAEAVVAVDVEGRVLVVNPALSRLLGVDSAASRGRPYLETLRHNGVAELLAAVLRDGAPLGREIRVFASEEFVFDAHAAPLLESGRKAGALLVLHDITRLRRLEQVRRDFVANVSHELRTPLSSIKGFAETLIDGALEDKDNRLEFVRTIAEHADRLAKMVDDLLDLSAIESGHRSPALAPTDLGSLAREAALQARPAASARGVTVETVLSDALPAASADGDQVRQILSNLLDNAVKYSERGGRVEVRARAADGELVVSIKDEGVGIPEADLSRVFERFYRVDKARTREAGGTGLGLAIVKHLVEAQGGRVWVESRQPGGSTFSFTLRAA